MGNGLKKPRIIDLPEDKGCLLFMTISELFREFAEHYPLKEFEILVISRDISTKDKVNKNGIIVYESKYDNIEFIPTLLPSAGVMNYAYGGENRDGFIRAYDNQLCGESCMMDLCCIVDMVLNDHVKCIILATALDMTVGYIPYLKDFIGARFGLKMYDLYDFNDPTVDVFDLGDEDAIRKQWELECKDLTGSDNIDEFMNRYMDSMLGKFRDVLNTKTVDQLVEIANEQGVYVNKRWEREKIIQTIIDRFR